MLSQVTSILAQSGSGGTNWVPWTKVLIVGAALAIGFVQWLMKTLRQQKAKKDALRKREMAREQMLRTGRPDPSMLGTDAIGRDAMGRALADQTPQAPPTQVPMQGQVMVSTDDAKRRLQEIAAKRRAELERLAQSTGGGGGAGGGGNTGHAPNAPPIRRPMPAQSMPTPQRQMNAPIDLAGQREDENRRKAANQKAARKAAEAEQRKQAAKAKVRAKEAKIRANEAEQSDYQEQLAMESRRAASAASGAASTQAASFAGAAAAPGPNSRGLSSLDAALARTATTAGPVAADWRRAFVLSELLGAPVSERRE